MGTGTDQQEAISVFHYNGSGLTSPRRADLDWRQQLERQFRRRRQPGSPVDEIPVDAGCADGTERWQLCAGVRGLRLDRHAWSVGDKHAYRRLHLQARRHRSLANFDSGKTWQRVNWNDEQGSPTNAIAFDGGFAVFSQEYRTATWQVTLYNNNGTLITTNVQSNTVYNMGPRAITPWTLVRWTS
jgi:hypothetical protein